MIDKGTCANYTDEELAAKTLADQDFYYCVVERYEAPLNRYIKRISGLQTEEVEDLLQDIFLKAYLNLNSFDQTLKFSSWLYRIAHNETISNHRKRKARRLDDQAALEDWHELAANFSLEEQLDEQLTGEQVSQVLSLLDGKYREVLVLRFLEDRSYEEISDILRKPTGTVATLINRAKKAFKQAASDKQIAF